MVKNISMRVFLLSHLSKKAYIARIIAKSPPSSQPQRYKWLTQAINEGKLTSSLEILAKSQIEGDTAIFCLANLQDLEVGR